MSNAQSADCIMVVTAFTITEDFVQTEATKFFARVAAEIG
jgi:hypothetical protein